MDRSKLKKNMPGFLRQGLARLRDTLNGPGIEHDVLDDDVFVADNSPKPRITLILPGLSAQMAFGGVTTGINIFADLSERLKATGFERRIVSEQAIDPADNVLGKYPALADCEVMALRPSGNRLPTRAGDIFLVYNWWISLNLEPVLAEQARHFAQSSLPKIHLIQEYEPHFYPFSSANLLAREAMGERWPLWAIFNTHELYNYWLLQGHNAEKAWVFEPRMSGVIRPFADGLTIGEKTRTVLVYGRPQISRNAFFLIERGLKLWAEHHGLDHPDWRIVSAGMAHEDVVLGNGHALTSLGKLSLESYGALLRETAIGLSLMSSPHPSYPPLEMAHFGARVLTNSYASKDPTSRHENLVTLPGIRPEAIAETLEAEITRFEADPGTGLKGKSHMPNYLGEDRVECLSEVAEAVAGLTCHFGAGLAVE